MENGKRKSTLSESSQYVKGVGPSRQVLLSRLGIETVEDLVLHFPRAYYDRSNLSGIARLEPGQEGGFMGTVLATSLRKLGPRRSLLTVAAGDETGIIDLVFFNQPYLQKQFTQGAGVIASGSVRMYRGHRQIVAPEYELIGGELGEDLLHTGRIVPVYPLTAGISQRMMRRIVRAALDKCSGDVPENLPQRIIREKDFPSRAEALRSIHYPGSWEEKERALRRFKFEEVFFLHLLIRERRDLLSEGKPRPHIPRPHGLVRRFLDIIPFPFTSAQTRVMGEIARDVESERGLARLLQGDVGSGKTVVALAAMLMAVGKGFQAAMMVPTEILAEQHAARIAKYLEKLPVRVELLIGSMKGEKKKRIQEELADGRIDLVVGTHALIQEGISFRQLGLAVIDEQHRFGVKQRARLGQGEILPHFLVMTATPIPRSLAQTVYGDLDLSVIDELPFGERDVETEIVREDKRDLVYGRIAESFRSGEQAFILYPLVQESEKSDLKAAVEEFERLQKEVFNDVPLGLLHGRMTFEEKSKAISMFREKDVLGLVTTTVIEVGVDVPDASILLINHPERFGLAQLHQLRGRVGRGGERGYCYLMLDENASDTAFRRLSFFASTTDGFKVAEMDLKLRGPGEIWGIRQSGYPAFRLLNPLTDREVVESSWEESGRLRRLDPSLKGPENRVVSDYYHMYYKGRMELADIG